MKTELTKDDLNFIIYSLNETKDTFSKYEDYPSDDFKKIRISDVDAIIDKIKKIKHNL